MTSYEHGFLTKCAEYGVPEEMAGVMLKTAQAGQASIDNHANIKAITAPGSGYEWLPKVYPSLSSMTPTDFAAASFVVPFFRDNYMGWVGRMAASGLNSQKSMYRDTGKHSVDKETAKPYDANTLGYYDIMYDPDLFDQSKLQFTDAGTNALLKAWSDIKSTPKVKPEDLKANFGRLKRNIAADIANSALSEMPATPPPEFFSEYADRVTGYKTEDPKTTFTGLPAYPVKPVAEPVADQPQPDAEIQPSTPTEPKPVHGTTSVQNPANVSVPSA